MIARTLLLPLLFACGGSKLPTTTLTVAGQRVTVEIAATEGARAQGLMHRDHLAEDAGMLFVYDDEKPRRFWMKDTRIPLSIAFMDGDGKILKISDMAPFSQERTSSLYPARYALEVNKGWFERHGIQKGVVVEGVAVTP